MRCPKCNKDFEHKINLKQGNHAEHICISCGQLMQWDYPIEAKDGHIYTGSPEVCKHHQLRNDDARVPL